MSAQAQRNRRSSPIRSFNWEEGWDDAEQIVRSSAGASDQDWAADRWVEWSFSAHVRDGRAQLIDQNETFGTLWRVEILREYRDGQMHQAWRYTWQGGWETQVVTMLEVVNSTPEPDGSFKHYFLRVPRLGTARDAAAWTFGMTADDYGPIIET